MRSKPHFANSKNFALGLPKSEPVDDARVDGERIKEILSTTPGLTEKKIKEILFLLTQRKLKRFVSCTLLG